MFTKTSDLACFSCNYNYCSICILLYNSDLFIYTNNLHKMAPSSCWWHGGSLQKELLFDSCFDVSLSQPCHLPCLSLRLPHLPHDLCQCRPPHSTRSRHLSTCRHMCFNCHCPTILLSTLATQHYSLPLRCHWWRCL